MSFEPGKGSLEGYYKQMAKQWRSECLAVKQENAELRKRAPSAPGLYRARLDEHGTLVVVRLLFADGERVEQFALDARELGF